MSSKTESVIFGESEDGFMYFAERFEARMQFSKLGKVRKGETTYQDYKQTVRNNSSEDHHRQAIEKGGKK